MSYDLDTSSARSADNINASIRESGKYIGTITRAEALLSEKGTRGLGLSFKAKDGASADYLDIYTHKANGEELMGVRTVNAILACLQMRGIKDGTIKCEKWDTTTKRRETVEVNGYPDLMGKEIGFLLQKTLETNNKTDADVERLSIFAVFSAKTELVASEILDKKANPERLTKMVEALAARPVRDNRKRGSQSPAGRGGTERGTTGAGFDDMDDDIPF